MKPLNEAYADEPLLDDIEVASEGMFLRMVGHFSQPLVAFNAHTGYWNSRRVVRGAADLIASLATVGEPVEKRRFFSWRRPADVAAAT